MFWRDYRQKYILFLDKIVLKSPLAIIDKVKNAKLLWWTGDAGVCFEENTNDRLWMIRKYYEELLKYHYFDFQL